jgi:hypothetical protein
MPWVIIGIVCLTISVVLASYVFMLGSLSPNWDAKDRRVLYIASAVVYTGACYVIISNSLPGA